MLRNVDRDKKNHVLLTKNGFKVFYFWECEIKNKRLLEKKTNQFLNELNRRNKTG
jgi:G:T-mismatch repair DNA endonuclease (very short patch repair protein)